MNLYLIRHGECARQALEPGGPPLTAEGSEDCRLISSHILELDRAPTRLYCSPLLRAVQTADFFARDWNLAPEQVPWLLPGVAPSSVLEKLRAMAVESIALVGHLPNLGFLLGALLWGLPAKEIFIPRGGVALLDCGHWDPGTAELRWLLSPEAFSTTPGRRR